MYMYICFAAERVEICIYQSNSLYSAGYGCSFHSRFMMLDLCSILMLAL